jgi:hypothetical protein
MRRLRTSGTATLLLVALMGLAVLLPEFGHSIAHRQAADALRSSTLIRTDQGVGHSVSGTHVAGDHLHPDLRARVPGKPLLKHMVAAPPLIHLCSDLGDDPQLPPAIAGSITPPRCEHGPPPPSRSPPLV